MQVSHEIELGLIIGSAVLLVGTVIAVPLVLRSLPPDHFVRPPARRRGVAGALRTFVGLTVVALGIAMLILPGQGVLTILVGLSILDLPAQRRAVAWLLTRPRVTRAVQRMRQRAGRAPLILPQTA